MARLFLYYEDLDAGWRWQQRGESVWYSPRSLVRHAVGAAETSATHRYYVERNRVLTAVRHADLPLAIYSLLVLALKVPQALVRWVDGKSSAAHGVGGAHGRFSACWPICRPQSCSAISTAIGGFD